MTTLRPAAAIASRATGRLLAGDVITIEPGIYLPGRGGVLGVRDVEVRIAGSTVLGPVSVVVVWQLGRCNNGGVTQ